MPAERAKVAAVFINRLRDQDEARERSDDDLRPDRRQGHARPRADARRPAVDLALQHLRRRRPAAGADLQSRAAPRSWRRPIRRRATARSISSPTGRAGTSSRPTSTSTIATSRAGRRSSAQRQEQASPPATRRLRRLRRHRRSQALTCLPVLLALALLAAVALGIVWFLRANPSTVARALRPILVLLGVHRRRRTADLRRALPAGAAARAVRPGGRRGDGV